MIGALELTEILLKPAVISPSSATRTTTITIALPAVFGKLLEGTTKVSPGLYPLPSEVITTVVAAVDPAAVVAVKLAPTPEALVWLYRAVVIVAVPALLAVAVLFCPSTRTSSSAPPCAPAVDTVLTPSGNILL
jgi:hypothetical protein